MIDYLTSEDYALYNPDIKPSRQRNAGGMQTKTYRVRDALEEYFPTSKTVYKIEDITADIVLVEPLWYILKPGHEPIEYWENQMNALKAVEAKKIIYGSEFSLLRVHPYWRKEFIAQGDIVTANCKFLRRLFNYVGISGTELLTDPMDARFVPGSFERKKRVVAMGSISWMKNTKHLIEVFKRLEGEVERVYIGSARLWGYIDKVFEELQAELFEHTDRIIPDASMLESILELQQAKVGFWCAYHDTFSSCTHEMLACGMPVVAVPHGHAGELPVNIESDINNQVDKILEIANMPDDKYTKMSNELAVWSRAHNSNSVFASQLREIIRKIL